MPLSSRCAPRPVWIPILLAVTGSFTLLAGLVVVALSITVPANMSVRISSLKGAVYVGASTCYTCHNDQSGGWSQTLSPQLLRNSVIVPRTDIPILQTGQVFDQIVLNVFANRYGTDVLGSADQTQNLQHYVIQTDAGDVLLGTPQAELLIPPDVTSAKPDLPVVCVDCHLYNLLFDTYKHGLIYFLALVEMNPLTNSYFSCSFTVTDVDFECLSVTWMFNVLPQIA